MHQTSSTICTGGLEAQGHYVQRRRRDGRCSCFFLFFSVFFPFQRKAHRNRGGWPQARSWAVNPIGCCLLRIWKGTCCSNPHYVVRRSSRWAPARRQHGTVTGRRTSDVFDFELAPRWTLTVLSNNHPLIKLVQLKAVSRFINVTHNPSTRG